MVMSPKDSDNDRQKHHRVKENFRTKTQEIISTLLNKLLCSEISVENHLIKDVNAIKKPLQMFLFFICISQEIDNF